MQGLVGSDASGALLPSSRLNTQGKKPRPTHYIRPEEQILLSVQNQAATSANLSKSGALLSQTESTGAKDSH